MSYIGQGYVMDGGAYGQTFRMVNPRAASPWNIFLKNNMSAYKQSHPTQTQGEIMTALGDLYRAQQTAAGQYVAPRQPPRPRKAAAAPVLVPMPAPAAAPRARVSRRPAPVPIQSANGMYFQ